MQKKVLSLVLAMVFLLGILAGCGGNTTPTPTPEDTGVSITDVVGNEVKLEKPATKVVGTHNPTMNQLIILGGGGKYIAGFGNKNMAGKLYELVYPELKDDVVQIGKGKDINYEQCVALGADLAILPERFKDQKADFEAVGIPAAVVLPNAESYDTIKESLLRVAKLIGEEEKANKINAFFEKKIANAKEIAAKSDKSPKILYLGGSSKISVANGVMLQSTMIETAGGVNVAKDVEGSGDFIEVTVEDIVKWNPEIILIPTFASYTVEDVLNDKAWGSIQAVKDKKVYRFPSELEPWDYPTPSSAMGLSWLIYKLNPDLYSLEQVVADANEYYEMVYGKTFTAEQLGLAE
ncbi:ABC transporter substrate-binding protein [Eubacteriales bacterium OttesenSCG-928-M02]|nr:ABC transporter substrate-binding protein [Eubacteriales bacterium OttesenSCG-928-M02]